VPCACFGAYYLIGSIPASVAPSKTKLIPTQTETKIISTQTATKIPPLVIEGCNPKEECPDAVAVRNLFPEGTTLDYNVEYKVSISPKAMVRFYIGWCTVDTKTLDDNLTHMEYVFTIDNESMLKQIKADRFTQKTKKIPHRNVL